nr:MULTISPECIES: ABC transporter transmembrane domain-containing protein [Pseudomonas]
MTEIPVIELPVAPQAATIEMDSALGCCRLLLQLSQGHESNIQARTGQADLSSAVRTYGAANGIDLRLERLSLHKLTSKMLPLAWRNRAGDFFLLARLSETQALIQSPLAGTPDVIERDQLAEQWSGQVIRVREGRLRFDLSWFIPELRHHRRVLGEVLLCSLLLQVLALATPLLFQAVMDKVMAHRALATLDMLVVTLVVVGVFEVLLKGLREYLSAHTAFLNETVGSSETIKNLAVEPQMQRRWESQTAESVEAGFASQSLGSAISQSVTLLQKVTAVAVISAGARTK